jgi:SAM-dependent methyltransferase
MSEHRHGGRGHGGGHGHGGHGHARDRHGNPEDFAAYLAKLEGSDRAGWQKPDEVVAALGLRPGGVAADVGVGPGYFALRMARAVAPSGRVHAIDSEPRMLDLLRERAAAAGVANVLPHLAADGVPVIPEPVDVVLVVNTYHHFPDGPATLRALAARLRSGGRLVNIDFHAGELPVGPPPEMRLSREAFLDAADEAGLWLAEERTFLPYQYFLALGAR